MKSILDSREGTRGHSGPRELKPPTSRGYAIQTLRHLRRMLEALECDEREVKRELDQIDRYEHWSVLGYQTREAMFDAELGELSERAKRNAAAAGIRIQEREMHQSGESVRSIARTVGKSKSQVHRDLVPASGTPSESKPVRLHPDPTRAAQTIIKARGRAYAQELAAAILSGS
jgi:hypothetical protein